MKMKSKICNLLMKKCFSFKYKVELSKENLAIKRFQNHFELSLSNIKDTNLDKKTFFFDNNVTIDRILNDLGKEYNFEFIIKESELNELSKLVKNLNQHNIDNDKDFIENIFVEIDKLMKNADVKANNQYSKILNDLGNYNKEQIENMKREYFMICSELNDSLKTYELIEKKTKFRTKLVFLIITLIFSFITGIFFYGIYCIDDLGWDIVEPTTFLFSSVVFIGCFYGYLRFQRKGLYSSGLLLNDLSESLKRKYFIKYNFNEKRFKELQNLKENLFKKIERI